MDDTTLRTEIRKSRKQLARVQSGVREQIAAAYGEERHDDGRALVEWERLLGGLDGQLSGFEDVLTDRLEPPQP